MHSNKMVVAIKTNGKVLRENGDTVLIPFGHEFSLTFKNLNSVRALVRVSIDGQDATEGTSGLIVPPNGTVDLERFIKGGNLTTGNKFKFIERTAKIEEGPRGIKVDDGLVRIEYEFEKQPAKVEYEVIKRNYLDEYHKSRPWIDGRPWTGSPQGPFWNINGGTFYSTADVKTGLGQSAPLAQNASLSSNSVFRGASASAQAASVDLEALADALTGITVPGSVSEQKFEVGSWFATDGQKHVMVLKLLGTVGEKPVSKPVTVKTKPKCTTCGHVNKATSKFCTECGTGLVLV